MMDTPMAVSSSSDFPSLAELRSFMTEFRMLKEEIALSKRKERESLPPIQQPSSRPPSPTQLNFGNVVNNTHNHNYVELGDPTRESNDGQTTPTRRSPKNLPPLPGRTSPSHIDEKAMNSYNMHVDNMNINQPETLVKSMGENKQKVPLEFSHTLPVKIPLVTGSTEADNFILWKGKVISSIEKIPKFTSFLSAPLAESWKYFKTRNESKYKSEDLMFRYIDCHQELYGFVMECLEEKFAAQTERLFQEGTNNLRDLLNFSIDHPVSYKNAHALIEYLEGYHVQTSRWRIAEIERQLCQLTYTGQEDPREFIRKFHDIHHSGKLMGGPKDWWPSYSDASKVTQIFARLIGSHVAPVRQSIQNLENFRPVTLKDMEEQLVQWWLSKDANKGHQNKPPYPKGQGQQSHGKKPNTYTKEGQTANPAHAASQSKNVKIGNSTKNPLPKVSMKNHQSKDNPTVNDEEPGVTGVDDWCGVAIAEPANEDQMEFANASLKEVYANNYIPQRHEMLWDTGATVSMTSLKECVEDEESVPPVKISTMSGSVSSNSVGTLHFPGFRIENIHVLPKTPYSLFSLSKATATGGVAVFTKTDAYLLRPHSRNDALIDICEKHASFHGERKGNLWVTPIKNSKKIEEKVVYSKQSTLGNGGPIGIIPKKNNPSPSPSPATPSKRSSEEKSKSLPSILKGTPVSSMKTDHKSPQSANHFAALNVEESEESTVESDDEDDSEY
jgi:disulfide oxidoreductase YuzD